MMPLDEPQRAVRDWQSGGLKSGIVRWAGRLLIGIGAIVLGCAAAAYFLLGRIDLGAMAAHQASEALGRPVTIAAMHVIPGRWLLIDLREVRVANISGGTRASMAELGHLSAEVETVSLLRGPLVLRHLDIDGLSVLLERTATAKTPNWIFGPMKPQAAIRGPASRGWFPTLLNASLKASEVTYRTASGHVFRIRLDDLTVLTEGADRQVRMTVAGAYNGTSVGLTGELQPIAVLRDAAVPYGVDLQLTSMDTTLGLKGTMTEPLDFDGIKGHLTLKAPTLATILALSGTSSELDVPLGLAGSFERTADLWRLTDASGELGGNRITTGSLQLIEGSKGEPDDVAVELGFDTLNLNTLVGREGGRAAASEDANVSLAIDRAPDTLMKVKLSAQRIEYDKLRFGDARLAAALTPGRVAVDTLALTYLGARVSASGQVEAADKGRGQISADVTVTGADVQQLRQTLGLGPVPLTGRLDGRVIAASTGTTLNAATRTARVSAAVSMTGGSIARQVIEMASTDVRLLFRKSEGTAPVACLLGVLDMRAGAGTVLPLRIKAANGAIVGNLQFDLYRRTFDLTVGSESASTGTFALDIPVRVFGRFDDPTVRPAKWSKTGRAMLAEADKVDRLMPDLQAFARRNPCLKPSRRGGGQ